MIMPKMGESIMEATILKWLKKEGDPIEEDESILEIATDKVDSEVPSPVSGTMGKVLFEEGETVEVGKVICNIMTEAGESAPASSNGSAPEVSEPAPVPVAQPEPVVVAAPVLTEVTVSAPASNGNGDGSGRFYSPLVLNIARQEAIGMAELETLPGTGKNQRVTKKDILLYVKNRTAVPPAQPAAQPVVAAPKQAVPAKQPAAVSTSGNVEIVEMDRMRKLIADHMVMSKKTSPHVTSFVEVDVTKMVKWRDKVKGEFQKREGQKITFTPLFMECVIKGLKDFPGVNASLDGNNIIIKKDLNIGMAAALPSGNLIVPVIKGADQLNLNGLTKQVNDLADRARSNKLKPHEIEGGTFTLTNVGTFGNAMGTPIINQPQVAILATGVIKKKPVVVESELGDTIAIRSMMFLSLSYDHRIVDGFLGGSFLTRVGNYMEAWDLDRDV